MNQYSDSAWLREIQEYWEQISSESDNIVPVVEQAPAAPNSLQPSHAVPNDPISSMRHDVGM